MEVESKHNPDRSIHVHWQIIYVNSHALNLNRIALEEFPI